MTARLVLGTGSLAGSLVGELRERRGRVTVLASDENAVRTLREEGVAAEAGDPTDEAALRACPRPDTVAVATEDAATNVAAAAAVDSVYPDAFLLAYAPAEATDDQRAALSATADEVVDALAATTDWLDERVGDDGLRTRKLTATLRDIDGELAIVAHDNPDPDAIASAVALARVAEGAGVDADVCYFGSITHQENRAFVNLLEYDLRELEPGADLSEYGGVALVDHSRPGVNDGLPEDTPVDIVVDHHPPRYPVEARFVDLRSEVGATSTLLVDYLRTLDITPSREVATGLLFGIRVDTDEYTREVSAADFEATAYLVPHADAGTLDRIESPSMNPETLDTIARAISGRERHGSALLSGVGELTDRDALAQAADRLLDLEDVTTTLVYGIMNGTIYVSARARGTDLDLGETLRDAFGQIGSAGGHADMAGAQISLGLLDAIDADDESLSEILDAIVTDRFLDAMGSRDHRVLTGVYPDDYHGTGAGGPTALDRISGAGGSGDEVGDRDGAGDRGRTSDRDDAADGGEDDER
ncbi:DHH family phosphoesterase [Halosimplex halophilum]|uniref:DHH family phosphoesterase n=1 Tax=Halosimplex halophilum TaxID=2559572 RepID=UPI00107F4181|nr:DHH family phosphoesterase [Halosimplex halophilum]